MLEAKKTPHKSDKVHLRQSEIDGPEDSRTLRRPSERRNLQVERPILKRHQSISGLNIREVCISAIRIHSK